jgi:hypothetical protein
VEVESVKTVQNRGSLYTSLVSQYRRAPVSLRDVCTLYVQLGDDELASGD